jgi:hypothetical protein
VSDLRISEIEARTPLWQAVRAHYEDKLARLRAKNDTRQSPEETAWVRGQIAEVKALLALDEPPREMPTEP